jgi:hypothetical protein
MAWIGLFPEIVFNFINCNNHEEGNSREESIFLEKKKR